MNCPAGCRWLWCCARRAGRTGRRRCGHLQQLPNTAAGRLPRTEAPMSVRPGTLMPNGPQVAPDLRLRFPSSGASGLPLALSAGALAWSEIRLPSPNTASLPLIIRMGSRRVGTQGACGGRDKNEQGEHVVVADDQFQPTPGELDCCPIVAAVRREKQPPARQQLGLGVVAALVADRHGPPAKQAHHQRGAEDPVAEPPWPVCGEDKCRHHVNVVVRPGDRGHQQAGHGARNQAE